MIIDYTLQMWKESGQIIAHVMPLDVMSAGATPQLARESLNEAVSLFLKTAADIGTAKEMLEEVGYTFEDGRWVSPEWVGIERHTLSVVSQIC